jgi:hypothetical protein
MYLNDLPSSNPPDYPGLAKTLSDNDPESVSERTEKSKRFTEARYLAVAEIHG